MNKPRIIPFLISYACRDAGKNNIFYHSRFLYKADGCRPKPNELDRIMGEMKIIISTAEATMLSVSELGEVKIDEVPEEIRVAVAKELEEAKERYCAHICKEAEMTRKFHDSLFKKV